MIILAEDYRRTAIRKPKPLFSGIDAYVYMLAGKCMNRDRIFMKLAEEAKTVESYESKFKGLGTAALKEALYDFKVACRRGKRGCRAMIPEALAAIREAAKRSLPDNPYPFVEQLTGALALNSNYIVEMATGEGKTLTAALTAVIWGWIGHPSHIITVNDYLADRDSKWLAPLYHYCDVTVGSVTGEMLQAQRIEGYRNDIVYTTSKEIVADLLRDRLCFGNLQKTGRRQIGTLFGECHQLNTGIVMRGIHSAIVDEADSIMIDEAVTPLIISKPQENDPFVQACRIANGIAAALVAGVDYRIDFKYREIELLPNLDHQLSHAAEKIPLQYRGLGRQKELIRQALTAKEFFHRDSQYILQDGKVVIVDEFTGRLMPQRTWRAGLHQLIEAKENLTITAPSETLARLSFQQFFRFFRNLAGMTGTASEAAPEFWHIYGSAVVTIPTHKPCLRKVLPRRIFPNQKSKWDAIVNEIVSVNSTGRPVLIGTRNVKVSEKLSTRLSALGLAHQVLNATRHKDEAQIIAHAGRGSNITVATNMAGRGTDIKLNRGIADLGGLHVIATECHESGRIDRQLFGRCARQGDSGSARSFVALDDELLVRYLPLQIRKAVGSVVEKGGRNAQWLAEKVVVGTQNSAQRIACKRRRSVLQMDTWLDDSLSFTRGEIT